MNFFVKLDFELTCDTGRQITFCFLGTFSTCLCVQKKLLTLIFFKGGGRNLYVNGMWLVGRMMAILDLLSKVASGEAGCEGSLDK